MAIRISFDPGPYLDQQAGSITAPGQATFLPLPALSRLHWLLAAQQGVVFQSAYPQSLITSMSADEGHVFHLPSANCDRILVIALIENATSDPGTITVTPTNGTGASTSVTHSYTGATSRWSRPSWSGAFIPATLIGSGIQYHKVTWTNLVVRHLALLEIPRTLLDPAADVAVAMRGGSFAGFESGRMITEAANGGLNDLLGAIASANAETRRHVGGIMLSDIYAWSVASKDVWANIADPSLLTSGFGFRHKARRVRSATTKVDYTVRVRARYNGGMGTGQMQVRSTSGSVSFSALTNIFAWHSPDAAGTLTVDAQADDTLIPEAKSTDVLTSVQVSSIQILEAV